jgi:hypothetical protein
MGIQNINFLGKPLALQDLEPTRKLEFDPERW